MTQIQTTQLLTNKSDIAQTKVSQAGTPYSCAQGDVVLAIKQFALTTNNITYAAFGTTMKYWDFFPTGRDDWGQIPVWGFADVVRSETDGIEVGERFYGFLPLASHVILRPERVSPRGFQDAAQHRENLAAVYNHYTRCSTDPGYSADLESHQSLLRPLFITSYVLADFMVDNTLFGADQILLSSASSKTAYGTAYALKQINPNCLIVGLTSVQNKGFVRQLGCYDMIQSYHDLPQISANTKTTYIDFSGSADLRMAIHGHFSNHLVYDCVVGSAQVTSPFRNHANLNPKPTFFFAPTQIAKRNAELGTAEQTHRMLEAQNLFFAHVSSQTPPWMIVKEHNGLPQAQALLAGLHMGKVGPQAGNVVVL